MLKCIIVDDEQPALNILTKYVAKVPSLQLELATTNALEAQSFLQDHTIDLLFLDIQMPDLDGISFLKSLVNPPKVIFTTAYDQYALKGYELEIIDYLLKPIPFDRFLKATNKASERILAPKNRVENDEFIWIKADYQQKKVELSNILFVEGLKDYVKIHTTEGLLMTKLNLKNFTPKLPSDHFIRVHRSFIINTKKVDSVQKARIYISDREIPVSEGYWNDLVSKLGL